MRLGLPYIEIPEISGVDGAESHTLGRIDGTSASYGKEEVYFLAAGHLDSLIHACRSGIRLDSSEFHILDAGSRQRIRYLLEETVAFDTVAAIDYHHSGGAATRQGAAGLFLRATSEDELGRCAERKIFHCL